MKISRKIQLAIIFMLSLMTFNSVCAVGGFNEWRFKTGWVLARGLVLDDNGNPSYVAYDEKGDIVIDSIDTRGNDVNKLFVLSGDEYRIYAKFYKDFIEQYADGIARGAKVLSGDDYEAEPFVTFDGKAIIDTSKGELLAGMVSVLVRDKNKIFIPDTDPSLLQAKINLNNIDTAIVDDDSIKSVLLDPEGNVLEKTEYNIGFKVQYTDHDDENDGYNIQHGDKLHAPLKLAALQGSMAYLGGSTVTDKKGFYSSMYMLPPCPGFSFNYTTPLTLELFYNQFHPRAKNRFGLYYLMKNGYDFCSGYSAFAPGPGLVGQMAQVAAIGIEASASNYIPRLSFYVDTAVIVGTGYFSNTKTQGQEGEPLPLGDTKYKYEAPDHEFETMADYEFDFDGDDKKDVAVLGSTYEKTNDDGDTVVVFEKEREPKDLQGIYLSSGSQDPDSEDENKNQPDFIRLADKLPDLKDQGLLESISEEDFKETDILIFRESNGLLITKRKGLEDSAVRRESGTVSGVDTETGEMHYSVMVRGPRSAGSDFASYANRGTSTWFSDWQSKAKMDPTLHKREADHIRPQEKIRVIAINRRTGYMGTVRTTYGKFMSDGLISMHIDKLIMRPPNLKIIAEREYEVEKGLTSDKGKKSEREYLIGYEGAALASDKVIKITTEWLDHDGSALPEELSEYGFTGRLAKIVSENTLGEEADGGALANFKIKPGRHMEQIQIGSDSKKNEHYYVQVSPECMDECDAVSFETGDAEGPLKYRPKNYVPVLTPISDEAQTLEQYRAYKKYKRENPETEIEKPEPIYKWFYRPELQFSLYSLEIKNIFRANDNDAQQIDVYQDETPVITSADDLVKILYNLLEQTVAPLAFLGAGQELVFALGEEEVKVDVGEDKQLEFKNLEHLSSLDVEDFLSLRLYSNNDAGNILWEYAFEYVILSPVSENDEQVDEYLVSADDPQVVLDAVIAGYYSRDEGLKKPYTASWNLQGTGTLATSGETNAVGGFSNTLTLPTTPNSTARVVFNLSNSNSKFTSSNFKVIPGVPAKFTEVISGVAAIHGFGEVTATYVIRDKSDNVVVDGTPVSFINESGSSLVFESTGITTSGMVSVAIKGGVTAGTQSYKVRTSSFEEKFSVSIEDIELEVVAPDSIESNQTANIRVNLNSAVSISGAQVFLGTTKGALQESILRIENNTAETQLYAGKIPGSGKLAAFFNEGLSVSNIEIERLVGIPSFSNSFVAGDESADGEVEIGEDLNGDPVVMSYLTSTDVTLQGTPNTSDTISLGSLLKPNKQAVFRYSFDALFDNQVVDYLLGHSGTSTNLTLEQNSLNGFNWSTQFKSNSRVEIPEHPEMRFNGSYGVTLEVLPETAGNIVTFERNKLSLEYKNNKFFAHIMTDTGLLSVESDVVSTDSWHTVGVHYYQNKLVLSTKSKDYEIPIPGSLVNTDIGEGTAVNMGGFTGNLKNLRIFNWEWPSLTTFEDGLESKNIVYPNEGELTFKILSTGQFKNSDELLALAAPTSAYFNNISAMFVKTAYAFELGNSSTLPPDVRVAANAQEMHVGSENGGGGFLDGVYALGEVAGQTFTFSFGFIAGCDVLNSCGLNSATAGDLTASFLLWGDIRDFIVQFGFDFAGDKRHSLLVQSLAGLGIVSNLLQVVAAGGTIITSPSGVGAVAGATLTGVLTWSDSVIGAAKLAAKRLNRLPTLNPVFGRVLDKALGPTFTALRRTVFSRNMLAFRQIDFYQAKLFVDGLIWATTAVQIYLVIEQLSPQAQVFWVEMFEDEKTLEDTVEFVILASSAEDAGIELTFNDLPTNSDKRQFLEELLIKTAYAAGKVKLADLIKDMAEETSKYANKNFVQRPKTAVKDSINLYQSIRKDRPGLLVNLEKPAEMVNAIGALTNVAAKEAVRGVLTSAKYTFTYGRKADFYRRLNDTDWTFMYKDGKFIPEVEKGLSQWVRDFAIHNKGKHAHMGLMSLKYFASKNRKIIKVEAPRRNVVDAGNAKVGRREHDVVTHENGIDVHNEIKSHEPDMINTRFDKYENTAKEIKSPTSREQLKLDIVEFVNNGYKGNRWIYPKKAGTYEFGGAIGAQAITKKMLKIVKEESSYFKQHLRKSDDEWQAFLKELKLEMNNPSFVELLDI